MYVKVGSTIPVKTLPTKNFWLTQAGPGTLSGNFIDTEQLSKEKIQLLAHVKLNQHKQNIQNFKNLSIIVKDANKPAFNDIVEKYRNGKIICFDSAINIVMKLSKARGTVQTKAKQTIANIDKPKSK